MREVLKSLGGLKEFQWYKISGILKEDGWDWKYLMTTEKTWGAYNDIPGEKSMASNPASRSQAYRAVLHQH